MFSDRLLLPLPLDFDVVGGVVHAEMLERTNLLAVVGGGHAPKFPDRNGNPLHYSLYTYIYRHVLVHCIATYMCVVWAQLVSFKLPILHVAT